MLHCDPAAVNNHSAQYQSAVSSLVRARHTAGQCSEQHLRCASSSRSRFLVTPGPRSSSLMTTYWFLRVSVASCKLTAAPRLSTCNSKHAVSGSCAHHRPVNNMYDATRENSTCASCLPDQPSQASSRGGCTGGWTRTGSRRCRRHRALPPRPTCPRGPPKKAAGTQQAAKQRVNATRSTQSAATGSAAAPAAAAVSALLLRLCTGFPPCPLSRLLNGVKRPPGAGEAPVLQPASTCMYTTRHTSDTPQNIELIEGSTRQRQ